MTTDQRLARRNWIVKAVGVGALQIVCLVFVVAVTPGQKAAKPPCEPRLPAGTRDGDDEKKELRYPLPKNPKQPVIVLRWLSRAGSRSMTVGPALEIRADGTMTAGAHWYFSRLGEIDLGKDGLICLLHRGVSDRVTGRISTTDLQRLLHFALEEQGLATLDECAVRASIRAAGHLAFHHWTTDLRVHIGGRSYGAHLCGARLCAAYHPELKALRGWVEVDLRLCALIDQMHAGGPEGVKKWLALVNKHLGVTHPGVRGFTADDLCNAASGEGARVLSFCRSEWVDENLRTISAYVTADGETNPAIKVHVWEESESRLRDRLGLPEETIRRWYPRPGKKPKRRRKL